MIFQEAKGLKIGNKVFIIGKDNKVHPKKVVGVHLRTISQIDITFTSPTEQNVAKGYVLAHQIVFSKEKDALNEVLDGHILQSNDIETKIDDIRDQIKTLERIENREAT